MGYNQGLAVGLAVGLPCFIVFIGVLFFYRRNKRLQREEDREGNDFDVEMGENGLFKEFGEALHTTAAQTPKKNSGSEKEGYASERPQTAETVVAKSLSSTDSVLNSTSSRTRSMELRPYSASFQNLAPEYQTPGRPASLFTQGGKNSAYDVYDSVIPIMAAETLQDPQLSPPPALAGAGNSERHSLHSSRGSLTGNDALTRSLENLAKQLQNPLFFDKVPSRAGTTLTKPPQYVNPRTPLKKSSANSSVVDLSAPFEQGGINDHFVNARSGLQNELLLLQQQLHPYRERLVGPQHKKSMSLERNFDDNITPDTGFVPQPDVVFK